jgi:hypothetical protein
MPPEISSDSTAAIASPFTATDVAAILREGGWLDDISTDAPLQAWLAEAVALLGPQAADRDALAELLGLIFVYDARAILATSQSHLVLAREGAREVIRELALQILDGPEVDSDRFKAIITALKEKSTHRGRELFYPIRLALAGRAGEGALDRVILLLDGASHFAFRAPVKGTRQRLLEFCAALE